MPRSKRFNDEKHTISTFHNEVWIKCPVCAQKAIATADYEQHAARLVCTNCGANKTCSTELVTGQKNKGYLITAAHIYFDAELWLQLPFKKSTFWAYNMKHLEYMEKYIAAYLRESLARTGFTLVEKLPKFIQRAENREPLLKLVEKLKLK